MKFLDQIVILLKNLATGSEDGTIHWEKELAEDFSDSIDFTTDLNNRQIGITSRFNADQSTDYGLQVFASDGSLIRTIWDEELKGITVDFKSAYSTLSAIHQSAEDTSSGLLDALNTYVKPAQPIDDSLDDEIPF